MLRLPFFFLFTIVFCSSCAIPVPPGLIKAAHKNVFIGNKPMPDESVEEVKGYLRHVTGENLIGLTNESINYAYMNGKGMEFSSVAQDQSRDMVTIIRYQFYFSKKKGDLYIVLMGLRHEKHEGMTMDSNYVKNGFTGANSRKINHPKPVEGRFLYEY